MIESYNKNLTKLPRYSINPNLIEVYNYFIKEKNISQPKLHAFFRRPHTVCQQMLIKKIWKVSPSTKCQVDVQWLAIATISWCSIYISTVKLQTLEEMATQRDTHIQNAVHRVSCMGRSREVAGFCFGLLSLNTG